MAEAGYNLIITTFPYMSEATVTVAKEYPDTMFCAIYQFINVGDASYANIWDTEYHNEGAFYVAGWLAGKATKTNTIGFQVGGEEPSPNAEGNAFMRGALAANPNVEYVEPDILMQPSFTPNDTQCASSAARRIIRILSLP